MKRFSLILLYSVGGILLILLALFCMAWAVEWRPDEQEVIYTSDEISILPDTLTILTWNTGYAGLGEEMDFFMDGGKRTRTTKEHTTNNLRRISEFLKSGDADIILLQEVDRNSCRSYGLDQFAAYRQALPGYHGYFALNYKSPFVPVPLRAPMGRVESGVAIFSKIPAEYVVRHQYHSHFSFPVRLFNLKRGWLTARFHSAQGSLVWIGATHNTAYDTGNMRETETDQLYAWLKRQNQTDGQTIVGGDWNQHPPGYTPSAAETEDAYFSVKPIPTEASVEYHYDDSVPSMRYLYEPLSPETTTSTIDFFLTAGFRCLDVKTVDLAFKNSDHNPVVATFVIEAAGIK